jgi:hypothetical protein
VVTEREREGLMVMETDFVYVPEPLRDPEGVADHVMDARGDAVCVTERDRVGEIVCVTERDRVGLMEGDVERVLEGEAVKESDLLWVPVTVADHV